MISCAFRCWSESTKRRGMWQLMPSRVELRALRHHLPVIVALVHAQPAERDSRRMRSGRANPIYIIPRLRRSCRSESPTKGPRTVPDCHS
jgi:hypothetical protein